MSNCIFAIVSDVHGHMDEMIKLVDSSSESHRIELDFVLQVGDFEPHRNEEDLRTMAAPQRYKNLGDFPKYHKAKKAFPWPIYFIGGNHEPYGFLDENTEGFKLVKNCTYLGTSFTGEINGLRICGLSGVYSPNYFSQPRPSLHSIDTTPNKAFSYFRESDVESLLLEREIDILLIHEWPDGLVCEEDYVKIDEQRRRLMYKNIGNEYARLVIELLKPQIVVCGHMHLSYRRTFYWPDGRLTKVLALANINSGSESVAIVAAYGGKLEELAVSDLE